MAQAFPKVDVVANELQKVVANIRDTDNRPDIKLLANVYHNLITMEKRVPGRCFPPFEQILLTEITLPITCSVSLGPFRDPHGGCVPAG